MNAELLSTIILNVLGVFLSLIIIASILFVAWDMTDDFPEKLSDNNLWIFFEGWNMWPDSPTLYFVFTAVVLLFTFLVSKIFHLKPEFLLKVDGILFVLAALIFRLRKIQSLRKRK